MRAALDDGCIPAKRMEASERVPEPCDRWLDFHDDEPVWSTQDDYSFDNNDEASISLLLSFNYVVHNIRPYSRTSCFAK
jgi:hypothetical protein